MGQDTKWITGAAGSLIRAIYLVLKFNLYLPRERVTQGTELGSGGLGAVSGQPAVWKL